MKKRIVGAVIALVLCLGLLPATVLADGLVKVVINDEPPYTCDTLENALAVVNAAAAGSATITLCADLSASSDLALNGSDLSVTLDLNGHALTLGGTAIEARMGTVVINEGATVTGTGAYKADLTPNSGKPSSKARPCCSSRRCTAAMRTITSPRPTSPPT